MPRPRLVSALLLLALVAPALGAAQAPETTAPVAPPPLLRNERQPLDGVLTGGVPQEAPGLDAVAAAGYRTIVDLRTDPELMPGLAEHLAGLGVDYRRIPVGGEGELDLVSARALDAVLDDPARRPLAVVCGSGNRVGALLALRAFWLEGEGAEAALELGESAGLSGLEPTVRTLVGLSPPPPPAPAPPPPPVEPPPGGQGTSPQI